MSESTRVAELEAELMDLYETLDERDTKISDLENQGYSQNKSSSRNRKNNNQETDIDKISEERDMLVLDLEKYRDELMESKDTIAELQNQLASRNNDNEQLSQDKRSLSDQVASQNKLLESQKKRLLATERQTAESRKLHKDGSQSQYALELENQKLRQTNNELEQNEQDLVQELSVLSSERTEFERLNEELVGKCDILQSNLDEKTDTLTSITRDHEELSLKVEAESDAQLEWETQTSKKADIHRKERAKLLDDLEVSKNKIGNLEAKIDSLKDTTVMGEMQRNIDSMKAELVTYKNELEASLVDKEQIEVDLENVYRALEDANDRQEERLMEAIAKERQQLKQLEAQVQMYVGNENEGLKRYSELEHQKEEVEVKLNRAEDWNAVYEEGHGLKDAVRYQKKLKADIKRRDYDLTQMSEKLGEEGDKRRALETACLMLKEKAGLPRDFAFEDNEIKDAMAGDHARLEAENTELVRQVDMLEADRLKLMRQLRDNAAQIGEKGIKYWGLSANQLLKVSEFATNLRDGVVELPLNDRSLELTAKVKNLEIELNTYALTIERLEREVSGLDGTSSSSNPSSDLFAMKEIMQQLQQDNKALRDSVIKMQNSDTSSTPMKFFSTNAKPFPMTPQIRKKVEEVLQEPLAEMTAEAQEQFTKMAEAHHKMMEELMSLREDIKKPKNNQDSNADVARLSMEVAKMINLTGASGSNSAVNSAGNFPLTPNTTVSFGSNVKLPPKTPNTPGGQAMLSKQLTALSLPPEEWADEVRELNGQLIESLEQLSDREKELDEHEELLRRYEGHLGAMRQQTALLYKDHMEFSDAAQNTEKRLLRQVDELQAERGGLTIRVQRYQELAALEEKGSENPNSVHKALRDLTRRVTIHEVNEQQLARKYGSIKEELKVQSEGRKRAEKSLVENEANSRKRLLYLEQYKSHSLQLTDRLQRQLEKSVASPVHAKTLRELSSLREDYLDLLHKESDVRLRLTLQKELPRRLKRYQHNSDEMEIALTQARNECTVAYGELEHQKMLTVMAGKDNHNHNQDVNTLVMEAARFRGEAARLELEFKSSDATVKKLTSRAVELATENDSLRERLRVSDSHERHGRTLAESARRKCLEVENKYDSGLTGSEATELLEKQEYFMEQLENLGREVEKYKELADLASSQASALDAYKTDHVEELRELQERCAVSESRTDDDAIIGRLQRQLLVAKQGYRDAVRKNDTFRSNLRRKEALARLFETRLDKREGALHKAREEARVQISALRDALRDLAFNGGDAEAALAMAQLQFDADKVNAGADQTTSNVGNNKTSILEKAKELSKQVYEMSLTSDAREEELNQSEEMIRRLESQVAELNTDKEIVEQMVADLQEASGMDVKSSAVAQRLISLSEEVRTSKLQALQARRQVQSLKEEKRHLEGTINRHEDAIGMLEEAKAEAETKNLLQSESNGGSGGLPDLREVSNNTSGDVKLLLQMTPSKSSHNYDDEDTLGVAEEFDDARARAMRGQLEETLKQMRSVSEAHKASEETLGEYRRRCEALQRDVEFFKTNAMVNGNNMTPGGGNSPSHHNNQANMMANRTTDQMASAAHTTISSLKQLIEEKNRIIEKYKRKLSSSKEISRRENAADRSEVERLTDRLYNENADAIEKLRNAVVKLERGGENGGIGGGLNGVDFRGGLVAQIEEAAVLIGEKDDTLRQLELKLRTAEAARERAEARCGGSLEEMERMKADMVTLAAQLQDAEERVLEAMEDRTASKKIGELQSELRAKETKMAALRQAVVRLKQAFLESEEARAATEITSRHGRREIEGDEKEVLKDEVSDMRSQLSSLIEEMAGAKQALQDAKASKEKSEKVLYKTKIENEKLGDEIITLEAEVKKANEIGDEAFKDKEEALNKLRRAAGKLKEVKGDKSKTGDEDRNRIGELEKRIMVLTSQNLALRSSAAGQRLKEEQQPATGDREGRRVVKTNNYTLGSDSPSDKQSATSSSRPSTGNAGSDGFSKSNKDAERKLQRRIEILEKRLEEKALECEAALGSSEQARKLMDKAMKDKDGANKQKEKAEREVKLAKHSGMGDLNTLEEVRGKLFELEEDNVKLRRLGELEQPRTIAMLRKENDEARVDKQDAEEQLKSVLNRSRGGRSDGNVLRDSESAFMREESLREELGLMKAAKRELEGKLLQRDGDAMELRFEVEQGTIDKSRMTRRINELQSALNSAKRVGGGNGGSGGDGNNDEREAGGRFKRERDLEGVVDALKRVVEKLKGENERLRRGAADSVRSSESERKAKDAMRQAQELQEENKSLRTRALAGDEAVQRNAQRQDLINQLRRQMKSRDDEMKGLSRQLEESGRSKSLMTDEMEHANKRTAGLEKELLNVRREASEHGGKNLSDSEAKREVQRLEREMVEQQDVIRTLRESSRGGSSGGGNSGSGGGREVYGLKKEISDLKSQMAAINRDKERLERRNDGGVGTTSREGGLVSENRKLKEQCASLQKELQAFDLDFFEEIEDLKFKYNEAVTRLRSYER